MGGLSPPAVILGPDPRIHALAWSGWQREGRGSSASGRPRWVRSRPDFGQALSFSRAGARGVVVAGFLPQGGWRSPFLRKGVVGSLLAKGIPPGGGLGRRSVGWARAGGQGRPVAPASHTDLVGRSAPLWGGVRAAPGWEPRRAALAPAERPARSGRGAGWRRSSARVGGAPSPAAAGPPRLRRQAGDHGGSLGAGE